ncbi:MAG: Fic family protein, partial [Lachnospiraceae bacterium]|nr:Fic family protein [Lachnospiraceae bacterium]
QYISIEKAIADTKMDYYDALARADKGWQDGQNDPKAFIRYMLAIVLSCYKDFESRILLAENTGARSTAYDVVKACTAKKISTFTKHEVLAECPSLGSSSVEAALQKLVREGVLVRYGAGRNTHYARNVE